MEMHLVRFPSSWRAKYKEGRKISKMQATGSQKESDGATGMKINVRDNIYSLY